MWILVLTILGLLYLYSTRNHSYWKNRGVPHETTLPFFGTHLKYILGRQTLPSYAAELYQKYEDQPLVGSFRGNTPEVLVRDPELIRYVLSTDFKAMHPRGDGKEPVIGPIMENIFSAEGEMWKLLRQRSTPTFSTEHLRCQLPVLTSCIKRLRQFLEKSRTDVVNFIPLSSRFAAEFMATFVFSLNTENLTEEFLTGFRYILEYFNLEKKYIFYRAIREIFPGFTSIRTILRPGFEGKDTMMVFVKSNFEKRNYTQSENRDFLDLILKLYNESLENKESKSEGIKVDLSTCAGQAFLILTTGIVTTSTSMSCTLHQLAYHPDIQSRVQEEIDQVHNKYGDIFTLEALSELNFLEMCLKESIRIFPPAAYTTRVCTVSYTFPKVGITIDKGVKILVSLKGLHHDPKFFPDPLKFIPERHSAENAMKQKQYTFIPFGGGPRQCIGERLARLVILSGLASLLRHYHVSPAPGSSYELCAREDVSLVTQVKGGVPLVFTPRDLVKE